MDQLYPQKVSLIRLKAFKVPKLKIKKYNLGSKLKVKLQMVMYKCIDSKILAMMKNLIKKLNCWAKKMKATREKLDSTRVLWSYLP